STSSTSPILVHHDVSLPLLFRLLCFSAVKTSHRHIHQITPGRLALLVGSSSLRGGVMSGHVYLFIISSGYPVHGCIFMCDLGCDGFPSLDLVGNPSTQAIPRLYFRVSLWFSYSGFVCLASP